MGAVLIVAPSWVGDMVMAQSLFKVLKAQDAGRAIDVLAPGWTLALLERMPEVRDAIEMPLGHGQLQLLTRRRLGISLRAAGYEQAILLPNSFKSALLPYWARIPVRTGYVGELRQWLLTDCRKLDRQRLTQTVQRFVALGLPDGAALTDPVPEPGAGPVPGGRIWSGKEMAGSLLCRGCEDPAGAGLASVAVWFSE